MFRKVKCLLCGRLLDQPDDPTTLDCGGDCLRCMAEVAEDEDCIKAMELIKKGQANDQ